MITPLIHPTLIQTLPSKFWPKNPIRYDHFHPGHTPPNSKPFITPNFKSNDSTYYDIHIPNNDRAHNNLSPSQTKNLPTYSLLNSWPNKSDTIPTAEKQNLKPIPQLHPTPNHHPPQTHYDTNKQTYYHRNPTTSASDRTKEQIKQPAPHSSLHHPIHLTPENMPPITPKCETQQTCIPFHIQNNTPDSHTKNNPTYSLLPPTQDPYTQQTLDACMHNPDPNSTSQTHCTKNLYTTPNKITPQSQNNLNLYTQPHPHKPTNPPPHKQL